MCYDDTRTIMVKYDSHVHARDTFITISTTSKVIISILSNNN